MQHAVIDIGSNSMRLTVYDVNGNDFKILFKEKIMAGLASYVEDGYISSEGIRRAYKGILEFVDTLAPFGISRENTHVFATASLRNIINTDEAVAQINAASGFDIDIITGAEEAFLGYAGAMREVSVENSIFVDIGGASTEITVISDEAVIQSKSYHVGSLKLYKDCVKKILPGKGSLKRINDAISSAIPREGFDGLTLPEKFVCSGGTSRSVLKFAKHLELIPENENTFRAEHLNEIAKIFLGDEKKAADTILKVDPERIHTIIPGFLILRYITDLMPAGKIVVCNYGVREGYLCQKILP